MRRNKYLFLFPSVEKNNAIGIVCNQFISYLSSAGYDFKYITADKKPYVTSIGISIPFDYLYNKYRKALSIFIGFDVFAFFWGWAAFFSIKRNFDYKSLDAVFLVAGGDAYNLMRLSIILKKNLPIKNHTHFVDGIPSPLHWGDNSYWRKWQKKTVSKLINHTDSLSAINSHMLNYIIGMYSFTDDRKCYIFSNPINKIYVPKEKIKTTTKKILYFGTLTNKRNAIDLVSGFKLALQRGLDAILIFQGMHFEDFINNACLLNANEDRIRWLPRSDSPSSAFKGVDLLVDVDINATNDIFISSKLMTYLGTDIPILSITNPTSPTAVLISDNPGMHVFYSDHNPDSIADTLLFLFSNIEHLEYSVRDRFTYMNSTKNICEGFLKVFSTEK